MSVRTRIGQIWKRQRGLTIAAAAVLISGAGLMVVRRARSAPDFPLAEVRKGEFVDRLQFRGEVKALRSTVLTAPSSAGDVQIVQLVKNGTALKKGDIVVQFDTTTVQRTLDQKRSELKQAEAEIERMRAQARMDEEKNITDRTKAGYDVERARLEASKQEILSQIEGEKNKLTLADAEQKLREVEEKLKAGRAGADADIESRKQKREKALFEVQQAERNLAALRLAAPSGGMATLLQNWRAGGFGGNAPEWKQGDRAWPGAGILELPDLSTIRITARIDESDRGRVRPGQPVSVRVDAVPDKELTGRVTEISPLAKMDFSGWPPTKNFDLAIQLDQADPRLRPGMSATARVAVDSLPDSILVPADAVFQKRGRSVVYRLRGAGFEEREIVISRRNNEQVAVSRGLTAGDRVARKDPTIEEKAGEP